MAEIALFPGVNEVFAAQEIGTDLDLDVTFSHKADLLMRWRELGEEVKRRVEHLPFNISLELYDLINEIDE